jgi:uncharacterized protein YbjT (DUF2867 family)
MFGPNDAFLTTILKLLRQLPIYPMFGRGLTRLQPVYVEDVAEAIARALQGTGRNAITYECGGRVYSYEEFLRIVAHEAAEQPAIEGQARAAGDLDGRDQEGCAHGVRRVRAPPNLRAEGTRWPHSPIGIPET